MTRTRFYIDLTLALFDLDVQANTFQVAILPTPTVGETSPITVPYRDDDLNNALADLEEGVLDLDALINLGEQLADRLLPSGQIRASFIEAVKQVGRDGGVRLRLMIHEPKLAQIPWEYSYLPLHHTERSRNHFLALHPQISLVRHEVLPMTHPLLHASTTPQELRMVIAMANPAGGQPLHLKKEKKLLEKVLADCKGDGGTITWQPVLEDVTLEELATALQQKADLFYFAGHGMFQIESTDGSDGAEAAGDGAIFLLQDKQSKEPLRLSAEHLALHLQNAGVRLAVFGTCESGRRDGVSAWSGIAPAIIERGIPAVVAMQYSIRDTFAIAFSRAFYSALACGLSLDEAVLAGRLSMLGDSVDDTSWGIPVLYMRSTDGVLFPNPAPQASATAAQFQQAIEQVVETIERGGVVTGVEVKMVQGSFQVVQKVKVVKGILKGFVQQ